MACRMLFARSATSAQSTDLLSRKALRLRHKLSTTTHYALISKRWRSAPVHEFSKYNPEVIESDWYEWWQERGLFKPSNNNTKSEFTMLLPPPNITGVLHLGHALTLSIQDAMARWNRMHGRSVNWVPGSDHAGISTQTVVEKQLGRTENGKTRYDLGRDAFIERVWEWKQTHGNRISEQTKVLGASLNWDQEYFTMDSRHSKVVRDAFIRLYDDGLVYRDTKMVNWSCSLQSVISDIEVDRVPIEGRTLINVPGHEKKVEFGVLYEFKFDVVNAPPQGPHQLLVATTRPETMLGDVALAINSNDSRYKNVIGRTVIHPLLQTEIPIIVDDDLVDPEFGTGVVKITPAHDVNDYQCAQRHQLPIISVFEPDGTISKKDTFGKYSSLSRWCARREVISDLDNTGHFVGKTDAGPSSISKCSRSGDIIEPMLKPQWYVRCSDLAKKSIEMVDEGVISLIPERQRTIWKHWLSNIEDWCVSRQLWWGHRIPIYKVSWNIHNVPDICVAAETEEDARRKAAVLISHTSSAAKAAESNIASVSQDEDVLDTWFSSGLLPLTAFNSNSGEGSELLPSNKKTLSSVLETGQDILFFWVARMAMLSTYFSGIPPFSTVLLHPMVRDSQGRKMSKSLGNVIDPLHIIQGASLKNLQDTLEKSYLSESEMKKGLSGLKKQYPNGFKPFGADALRFTLILYMQQTQQINMNLDNVKSAYHFCNKIWNTFVFVHKHANEHGVSDANFSSIDSKKLTLFDKAILSRLASMLDDYNTAMKAFRPAFAADVVREFIQKDFCDRYIEVSKLALFNNTPATQQDPKIAVKIMFCVLDIVLRAMHPFMPFLTEELWQKHNHIDPTTEKSIMECAWSPLNEIVQKDIGIEADIDLIFDVISAIRSLKQQSKAVETNNVRFSIIITPGSGSPIQTVDMYAECIRIMCKESAVKICTDDSISIQEDGDGNSNSNSTPYKTVVVSQNVRVIDTNADNSTQEQDASGELFDRNSPDRERKLKKLQSKLDEVLRTTESEGYQNNAPDSVKESDRNRISVLKAKISAMTI